MSKMFIKDSPRFVHILMQNDNGLWNVFTKNKQTLRQTTLFKDISQEEAKAQFDFVCDATDRGYAKSADKSHTKSIFLKAVERVKKEKENKYEILKT